MALTLIIMNADQLIDKKLLEDTTAASVATWDGKDAMGLKTNNFIDDEDDKKDESFFGLFGNDDNDFKYTDGDVVSVIAGKYKGKEGVVVKVSPSGNFMDIWLVDDDVTDTFSISQIMRET